VNFFQESDRPQPQLSYYYYYYDESNMGTMGTPDSSSQSFWRWRRPKFTNTGIPTDTAPAGTAADEIANLFGDTEVCDVILQGSDGGTIFAVKAILAARSTIFRSRLYGPRSKADLSIPGEKHMVKFQHWDCRILHMVVEYCYTDMCAIMNVKPNDDVARIVSQLRVASKAFKLPGLLHKIKQWAWRQINRHPGLACAMVDEGMKLDDIDELALQTLQIKTRAAMLPEFDAIGSGVLALTKPGLLFVLRTLEDTTSHLLLLQAIERWVDFSPEDSNLESPSREKVTREAFGRKCAVRFIKASKINPLAFERAIKQSKLFQTRNDLTSVSLLEGLQFSEKSFSMEAGSEKKKNDDEKAFVATRRPSTAIGITRPNMDVQSRSGSAVTTSTATTASSNGVSQ
jgi:hypothetical protein